MGKVTFTETMVDSDSGNPGKMVVFKYAGTEDPVLKLDEVVSKYVGDAPYTEFVDVHMDNPWVRVIIIGMNEMKQKEFNPQVHSASA